MLSDQPRSSYHEYATTISPSLPVILVLILDKNTDETALQMDTAIDLTQPVGDVSGYLMKEGNNLVKDWKRRWFVFTPLELRYYKKEGVRRVGHMTLVIALQI